MSEIQWNVAQVPPRCEREVRDFIEGTERGAFVPTHVRGWVSAGHKRFREHPLCPGYVFFALAEDDHGFGAEIHFDEDRKARVLGKVADEGNVARLMLAHATGAYNAIQHRSGNGQFARKQFAQKKRRRRPRHKRKLSYLAYINGKANHDRAQSSSN